MLRLSLPRWGSTRAHGASAVMPGGIVVCAGIHMSDIPAFPYEILWEERNFDRLRSLHVGMGRIHKIGTQGTGENIRALYGLEEANDALSGLREGRLQGGSGSAMDCGPAR